MRVVEIAQRYDLDRPYNGARRTGQVLEEIERSEQRVDDCLGIARIFHEPEVFLGASSWGGLDRCRGES